MTRFEVQWWDSQFKLWGYHSRTFWLGSAGKRPAKLALNKNCVPRWRVVEVKTGRVLLSVRREL